eukprot:366464-Chlamydomonas_euryale.AAC.8
MYRGSGTEGAVQERYRRSGTEGAAQGGRFSAHTRCVHRRCGSRLHRRQRGQAALLRSRLAAAAAPAAITDRPCAGAS